jgi:hypothetical protein
MIPKQYGHNHRYRSVPSIGTSSLVLLRQQVAFVFIKVVAILVRKTISPSFSRSDKQLSITPTNPGSEASRTSAI